jgi:hypothetical protein
VTPRPQPLADAALAELRETFGATWQSAVGRVALRAPRHAAPIVADPAAQPA